MSSGVTAAVIAAVVSVVVAIGSVTVTFLTTRASLRRDHERQEAEFRRAMTERLYDRRVAAYPGLFKATEAFRKSRLSSSEDLRNHLAAALAQVDEWHGQGGGLLLSARAYEQLLQLRSAVRQCINCAEFVSLGVGRTVRGAPGRPNRCRPGDPQWEKAPGLVFAVLRAASQAEVHAVPGHLRISDRHKAQADSRVLLSPGDNLAVTPGQNLPARCLPPEPGQPGQAVSVNAAVTEPDGHGSAGAGIPDCIPRTGPLLPRSAQVTAGAASGDIADQREQRPNGHDQALVPAWRRIASAARGPHHRSPPVST